MTHLDYFLALRLIARGRADQDQLAEAIARCFVDEQISLPRQLVEREMLSQDECRTQLDELRQFLDAREWDYAVAQKDLREELDPLAEWEFWTRVARQLSTGNQGEFSDRYFGPTFFTEGALGQIFAVTERSTGRRVALKRMKEEVSRQPEMTERFLSEGQITARLEHPNIVPVYEFNGQSGGPDQSHRSPYYTMRLLEGRTFTQAVAALKETEQAIAASKESEQAGTYRQERRRLLIALIQVSNALDYAHSMGVVHRDLKPDNILLGKFGEVILLDWGLACLRANNTASTSERGFVGQPSVLEELARSHTGDIFGSPAYMAPEQAAASPEKITWATDVFGLGGLLFYLLSGRPPYVRKSSESDDDILARIADGKRPALASLCKKAPPALVAIAEKAMTLDPANRYASARAFGVDIQRWILNEAIEAYPEPLPQRVARWAIRRQSMTITLTSATLLAILFIVGFLTARWAERHIVGQTQSQFIARRAQQLASGADLCKKSTIVDVKLFSALLASLSSGPVPDDLRELSESELRRAAGVIDEYNPGTGYREVLFVAAGNEPTVLMTFARTEAGATPNVDLTRKPASEVPKFLLEEVGKLPPGEVYLGPNDPHTVSSNDRIQVTNMLWGAIGIWKEGKLLGCVAQRTSLADAFAMQLERIGIPSSDRVRYHMAANDAGEIIWTPGNTSREILKMLLDARGNPFHHFLESEKPNETIPFEYKGQSFYVFLDRRSFQYTESKATFVYLLATNYTRLSGPSLPTVYYAETTLLLLVVLLIAGCLWLSRAIVRFAYPRQ